MPKSSRVVCLCGWAALAAAATVCAAVPSIPQVSTYPYPTGAGPSSSSSSSGRNTGANPNSTRTLGTDFPTFDPNFSHRQMVARREDLKKHMVDNAARLLMLARDLQADLQSREPTEADAKRLEEIAKLARTVRDQMRQ